MLSYISRLYPLIKYVLFQLDPERAHLIGLKCVDILGRFSFMWSKFPKNSQSPTVDSPTIELLGLQFPNRVGLAAGFDKDGEHVRGLSALGFGFIEVGTVTPKPQLGNPRPRLFRLVQSRALINRMGFNNSGVDKLVDSLRKANGLGIIGVNIGKNKTTPDDSAVDDYVYCLTKVWDVASYIVVNVSSPNTPGLRNLQHAEALSSLMSTLKSKQLELAASTGKYKPILLKIAPDLSDQQIQEIASIINDTGIDGVIATNSTLERSMLTCETHCSEAGGLTGTPLFPLALRVVSNLRIHLKSGVPIIGCGGISCVEQARQMLVAGADLIQVYTGFVYNGPNLIKELGKLSKPSS